MFKKLFVVAALAVCGFGSVFPAVTQGQEVSAVIFNKQGVSIAYVQGAMPKQVQETLVWSREDTEWLKDTFASAQNFSVLKESNIPAIKTLVKFFEAKKSCAVACVFPVAADNVGLDIEFSAKTEAGLPAVRLVVYGQKKECPAYLLEFATTLALQKAGSSFVGTISKIVGGVVTVLGLKRFVVDPYRRNQAKNAEEEKARIAAKNAEEEKARIAAKNAEEEKARIAARAEKIAAQLEKARKRKLQQAFVGLKKNPASPEYIAKNFIAATQKAVAEKMGCEASDARLTNKYASDTKFSVVPGLSVWSMQGFKGGTYDAHLNEDAVDFYQQDGWTALAVYDGHAGGRAISDALCGVGHARRLLFELVALLESKNGVLDQASLDALFVNFDSSMRYLENGSTAGICVVNFAAKKGYFIVLGDSQPVAIYNDGTTQTLDPHDGPAQGSYLQGRGWPLDHAFGNYCYKLGTDHANWQMKIIPKFCEFSTENLKYLLVASDGVYEHDRVTVAGTQEILEQGFSREAEALCFSACLRGWDVRKHDHTSAIVLNMKQFEKTLLGTASSPTGSRTCGEGDGEFKDGDSDGDDIPGRSGRRVSGRGGAAALYTPPADVVAHLKQAVNSFELPRGVEDISDAELACVIERPSIPNNDPRIPDGLFETFERSGNFDDVPLMDRPTFVEILLSKQLPFHKIVDGLYLGDNQVTKGLVKSQCSTLDEINNLNIAAWGTGSYLLAEAVLKSNWAVNPHAMPKLPGLIVILAQEPCYQDVLTKAEDFEINRSCNILDQLPLINGIRYLYCPCKENGTDTFTIDFEQKYQELIFRAYDEALARDEIVLTHCSNGAHRSASVLLWYLKQRTGEKFWMLNALLRNKRPQVLGVHELFIDGASRKGNMMKAALYRSLGMRNPDFE